MRHAKTRDNITVKHRLTGETICRPWILANKEKRPRDTVKAIQRPQTSDHPRTLTRSSYEMAEIASNYHREIQRADIPENEPNRPTQIDKVLQNLESPLPRNDKIHMSHYIKEHEIIKAIKALPNGKAAGLDGIPYELWKKLAECHKKDTKALDICRVMQVLFNDIERHGTDTFQEFTDGWMCPLYKKNDRTLIENYRPITVLNSDYRVMTRTLATRLTEVAQNIIHPDQAGFMKGRQITDQTELVHLMLNMCEADEKNGAIICLDQEKAYDKIRHDFLWDSLKKFDFPNHFVRTVQSLYNNAHTVVIINGVISSRFRVTRGVRQGDPMSCILFNIAIESLACMLRKSTLKGFTIKGDRDRLIASLFADDTTVYLHESDSFDTLQDILKTWCQASGARFNIKKTVIIPMGSPTYRMSLMSTRKLNAEHQPISNDIKIAVDGEPVRILGTYAGHKIPQINIWSPILEKIDINLERWNRGHPTQEGKRLIIGMEVGGRTQYLTRVQGMPKSVENAIIKRISNFMWGETKAPPVSLQIMYSHLLNGGKKLLDIRARNEAIELMKAKVLLGPIPQKPRWVLLAEDLMNRNVPKHYNLKDDSSKIDPFLQNWSPYKSNTAQNTLPASIRRMLKTMKTHHVAFDPINPSQELALNMPIWRHIGHGNETQPTLRLNGPYEKCLRATHKVKTVQDMLDTTNRLQNTNHKARRNCACNPCKEDRSNGCRNPHKCITHGNKYINTLPRKWNPGQIPEHSPEGTDPDPGCQRHTIVFNTDVEQTKDPSEGYRVFWKKSKRSARTIRELLEEIHINPNPNDRQITVFTDGSYSRTTDTANAGCGIWFGEDDERNMALRMPDRFRTNNAAELAAILAAASQINIHDDLHIISDSKYVIDGITKHIEKWENIGWIGVKNSSLFKAVVTALRLRKGITTLEKVKGHSGVRGNEEADKLAAVGAQKDSSDEIDTSIPEELDISGAKLQSMTQAILYKGIIENREETHRRTTNINLERIALSAKTRIGYIPEARHIWASLKNKDISRNIRAFLWKAIHGAHRCGKFWSHIPNYEHRAICPSCGVNEDMDHILTECQSSGQRVIWKNAINIVAMKGQRLEKPNIGTLFSCALKRNDKRQQNKAIDRFYSIIISESLFLVWKIRCEWRIQRDSDPLQIHTDTEVHNRWVQTINYRLKMDCLMTNKKYERKALSKQLVLQTWRNTLANEDEIPNDWVSNTGVLVGIETLRPPGRNR